MRVTPVNHAAVNKSQYQKKNQIVSNYSINKDNVSFTGPGFFERKALDGVYALYKKAKPEKFNEVPKAIAAYIKKLTSDNVKFDNYNYLLDKASKDSDRYKPTVINIFDGLIAAIDELPREGYKSSEFAEILTKFSKYYPKNLNNLGEKIQQWEHDFRTDVFQEIVSKNLLNKDQIQETLLVPIQCNLSANKGEGIEGFLNFVPYKDKVNALFAENIVLPVIKEIELVPKHIKLLVDNLTNISDEEVKFNILNELLQLAKKKTNSELIGDIFESKALSCIEHVDKKNTLVTDIIDFAVQKNDLKLFEKILAKRSYLTDDQKYSFLSKIFEPSPQPLDSDFVNKAFDAIFSVKNETKKEELYTKSVEYVTGLASNDPKLYKMIADDFGILPKSSRFQFLNKFFEKNPKEFSADLTETFINRIDDVPSEQYGIIFKKAVDFALKKPNDELLFRFWNTLIANMNKLTDDTVNTIAEKLIDAVISAKNEQMIDDIVNHGVFVLKFPIDKKLQILDKITDYYLKNTNNDGLFSIIHNLHNLLQFRTEKHCNENNVYKIFDKIREFLRNNYNSKIADQLKFVENDLKMSLGPKVTMY